MTYFLWGGHVIRCMIGTTKIWKKSQIKLSMSLTK